MFKRVRTSKIQLTTFNEKDPVSEYNSHYEICRKNKHVNKKKTFLHSEYLVVKELENHKQFDLQVCKENIHNWMRRWIPIEDETATNPFDFWKSVTWN